MERLIKKKLLVFAQLGMSLSPQQEAEIRSCKSEAQLNQVAHRILVPLCARSNALLSTHLY